LGNNSLPLRSLIDSKIGDYAAENDFQKISDVRGVLARILQGSILTEKGVKALSE